MLLYLPFCFILVLIVGTAAQLRQLSTNDGSPKGDGAHQDKYHCECQQVPSDDGQFTMRCHCTEKPKQNAVLAPNGGNQGPGQGGGSGNAGGGKEGKTDEEDETCPFGCPEGWTRFGYSENCYLLPSQPAKLDTFWNQLARCKAAEKTSYIMVIDGIFEQAVATPVAIQYALNWLGVLGNGFLWLGGYTDDKGWKFLDGTDQTSSILMVAANVIGSTRNNTCLGADAKTLGLWQTYPCYDKTGAAICEMPPRRVCGRQGGMLPITPISMSLSSLANLFPKLPSVPFIGQILGESALDNALTGVGSKLSDLLNWISGTKTDQATQCPIACPVGWVSSSLVSEHCYLLPNQPAKLDTFWNTLDKCKKTEPTSYISISNGFMEQAIASAIAAEYAANWIATGGTGHFWLGGYTNEKGWKFLDGTDETSNVLMSLANLVGPFKNNTCLAADIKTAGLWYTLPCTETTGTAFCEMPMRPVCGPQGSLLPISPLNLDAESLKNLFPRMPSIPFIGQILGGKSWDDLLFNPHDAQKYNLTGVKYGDATTHVMCTKKGTGFQAKLNGKPDWTWLYIENKEVDVPGKWTQQKCKGGKIVDAFRIMPATYLSVWSHCRNRGYEAAQPANNRFSGWYPFQVEKNFTDYYQENTGWFSKLTATYSKTGQTPIDQC